MLLFNSKKSELNYIVLNIFKVEKYFDYKNLIKVKINSGKKYFEFLTLKIIHCIINSFSTRLEISPSLARNSEGITDNSKSCLIKSGLSINEHIIDRDML